MYIYIAIDETAHNKKVPIQHLCLHEVIKGINHDKPQTVIDDKHKNNMKG